MDLYIYSDESGVFNKVHNEMTDTEALSGAFFFFWFLDKNWLQNFNLKFDF